MTEFTELGLHDELVQTVTELGYDQATPIQAQVIPLLLAEKDVIGQAQTGTGKTAAFSLPILHNLEADGGKVKALVLAPTRELALQVARAMVEYGRSTNLRVLPIYGGTPYSRQIRRLKRGVDIVVGTPGRVIDLMEQKKLDLSGVRHVVLDEADEMLSMGFIDDIETILSQTPETRQTALFSATLPNRIRHLADKYLIEPEVVRVARQQLTVESIAQRYYLINEDDKLALLTRLLELEEITSALIFARTRADTGHLANALTQRGYNAEPLNGDLSQEARERVLGRFRDGQMLALVATDVAARGLDIDDISHVFNFDLPPDPEVYVHRVGRTGRAGRDGVAISLVTPKQAWRMRKIEAYSKQKVSRAQIPTHEDILAYREEQLLERMQVWLRRGRGAREREMAGVLVAEGHDPIDVAAAALKIARQSEKQRPIERISEVVEQQARQRRRRGDRRDDRRGRGRGGERGRGNGRSRNVSPRASEEGMVRLTLDIGKNQGVRPADVVGSIAYHADLPGKSLGAIRIQHERTFVDVPEQYVAQVLAKSGDIEMRRQAISVTRA